MDDGWIITETEFDPARLHHKETVFTLGNGYLSTRGAFEEGYPGAWPATLIHGIFDDVPISFTELANCPDWLPVYIWLNGERFRLDRGAVLEYRRQLDLRTGVLSRTVRWRSPLGHTVELAFERFVSLADPHVLSLRCQITPLGFGGAIKVQAGLHGFPDNRGVAHWEWLDQGGLDGMVWLHSRTRHTEIELGMAARLTIEGVEQGDSPQRLDCQGCPALEMSLNVEKGQSVVFEKVVTVFSSRDVAAPAQVAREKLAGLPGYDVLRAANDAAWADVWWASDVVIEGDVRAQQAIRYNLFQVLIAAPRHDDRVSIPAKTLSGFGYRGHVFWDTELFVLPFLIFTQPALARHLLSYRYHSLGGARRKAQAAGYEGAMYPWESADTGDEVTPRWVPGPQGEELVRIWTGDIELHISSDVAYGAWKYWRVTGDDDWMRRCGAEIILDTAVFWGSRVEENAEMGAFEISDVIGPDEYHEHVDNNAFTNRMVQWHLETALRVLGWLREEDPEHAHLLTGQLDLNPERLAHWSDVIGRLRVLHDPESGLIEQFEGFFNLQDLNLSEYEPRSRSMQSLLGIEGANRCQVLKQPDVLMLLYLLRDRYDQATLKTNWDYYAPRTDHSFGSSLGPAIHAILACELGMAQLAYEHFMRAALVDLEDVRGNTADGIHAASAGAAWQAVVMGFGGLRLTDAGPVAVPRLPPGWERLKFRIRYRGQWHDFELTRGMQHSTIRPEPVEGHPEPVERHPEPVEGRGPAIRGPAICGPAIRGIIFDLDGVLTDTSELHYQGWQRLADEEGIPFDRDANEALRGVSRRDSLTLILGDRSASEVQVQAMMARKNRYYQESIEAVTPEDLLPGVLDLLTELHAAGIKIAVGSASKNAGAVIERLGITKWVDAVSDGYSVERQKPAPDLFLHAGAQLDLPPEQCLVVEDATSGIQAALAAGMWTLGLGPVERVGAAHVVLPNLAGIRWTELLAQLEEKARAREREPRSSECPTARATHNEMTHGWSS